MVKFLLYYWSDKCLEHSGAFFVYRQHGSL